MLPATAARIKKAIASYKDMTPLVADKIIAAVSRDNDEARKTMGDEAIDGIEEGLAEAIESGVVVVSFNHKTNSILLKMPHLLN